MRNLDDYEIIFCDIDDTLIHGPFVKFMDWLWKKTNSQLLATICMELQDLFNLYRIDTKLQFMLKITATPIVFLTARKHCNATKRMINKIMHESKNIFIIEELATSIPAIDKACTIEDYMEDLGIESAVFFDDNKDARQSMAWSVGVDTFDFSSNDEMVV